MVVIFFCLFQPSRFKDYISYFEENKKICGDTHMIKIIIIRRKKKKRKEDDEEEKITKKSRN